MFSFLRNASLSTPGLNIGFVNFFELWTSILSSTETAEAYGYTNTSMCLVSDSTTVGACATPETYLYWQHARELFIFLGW